MPDSFSMVFLYVATPIAALMLLGHILVLPTNCIAVLKNPDPLRINPDGMTEVHIASLMQNVDALQATLTRLKERQ